jgi:hypothetical protein
MRKDEDTGHKVSVSSVNIKNSKGFFVAEKYGINTGMFRYALIYQMILLITFYCFRDFLDGQHVVFGKVRYIFFISII